jgi:hypothetical protein
MPTSLTLPVPLAVPHTQLQTVIEGLVKQKGQQVSSLPQTPIADPVYTIETRSDSDQNLLLAETGVLTRILTLSTRIDQANYTVDSLFWTVCC